MEEKNIEIPFGALDSELGGFEYTIPEGYEAEIKDGKVIVKEKESEDEKIRKEIKNFFSRIMLGQENFLKEDYDWNAWIAWLEKQGEQKPITFNDAHIIDSALNDYCCKQYDALHKENGGVLSFARLQHLAMDIYGWCKKQGEQKPAWSEVDNINYKRLLYFLDGGKLMQDHNIELFIWLKSLKERYAWKPSESDILLLERIANGKSNPQDFQASLYALIGQLKNLREE